MKNSNIFIAVILLCTLQTDGFGQTSVVDPKPSFKDVLSLRSVRTPVISPDGLSVVYTVRSADWEKNEFDTEIWLARDNDAPFQLTRTKDGSSSSPRWSPDGHWLSFLSSRDDKTEVYLINPLGGEASRLTEHSEGISTYRWSPDGSRIAFEFHYDIYVMDSDGSNVVQLTNTPTVSEKHPSWGPVIK